MLGYILTYSRLSRENSTLDSQKWGILFLHPRYLTAGRSSLLQGLAYTEMENIHRKSSLKKWS